jgi:hypothetical protein
VGGITILKEHLARVRPQFLAARAFQRTTYLPGEISQIDWWHTGREIPVGKGAHREAFGLVATLPHSAAHAAVFTFGRTVGDLLPAALGCFQRLGGVPEKAVCDNDAAIVAERRGGVAILHDEVASFFGQLGTKVVPLRPGDPQAKGQVERTNGYLDRSFLSLRTFADLHDLQAQHDDWAATIAFARHHRRVERSCMTPGGQSERSCGRFPTRPLTPLTGRRFGSAATASAASQAWTTRCRLGLVDAVSRSGPLRPKWWSSSRGDRSPGTAAYVPADVVIAPEHARALRLAREARARLAEAVIELPEIDLDRYDALVGVGSAGPWVDPSSEDGSEGFQEPRLAAKAAR